MEATSGIDTLRENLRLQQVYTVMLRYGLDIGFNRLGFLGRWREAMQAWVWNLPKDLEIPPLPTKIRLMIEELGPTYVKVGQIVSSQASNIPPEWAAELEKLQSNVPPFPEEQVREILQKELKGTPEELFGSFSLVPMAAASTAQVHRATLLDGTDVVVKIQRPGIHEQMKADVGIMANASRVLSKRVQGLNALAMRLAQNMEACPGVSVCTTYPDFSSSRVLTMDFVRGVKISDLDAITAAGIDREELATNALRALVKQLMIDGFFHADPHPGNILVNTQTGHVTFIDTGMVGELTVAQRLNFIQLLMSLQNKDVEGAASVLKSLSVPFQDEINDAAYTKDFRRSLGPYMIGGATMDFAQTLSTAMDVLRRNGLRLDPNLTLATKALMQTEAITALLFPQGGLLAQGVRIAQEEAVKQISSENVNKMAGKALGLAVRELSAQLPSITEAGLGWFKQFRKGRFEVYVDTSAISKEVKTLNRFGRQAVVALMMVGLIIGSAIVTAAIGLGDFEGEFWRLVAQLAVLSYFLASVVAALIVLRLVWRWLRGADPGED